MPRDVIGDDPRDRIGRPARSPGSNDGNGARGIGLGMGGGGGKHGGPGGKKLAALHGFLLLSWGGLTLPPLAISILAGMGMVAIGVRYGNLTCRPL